MGPSEGESRAAYCQRMAHATYDLAEQCDDDELLRAYLSIAGKWVAKAEAEERPGSTGAED